MRNRKEIHDRVLNAASLEELRAAYSDWAERYDGDLLGEMGYVAPLITSKVLTNHMGDKNGRILDAGCGTGIVGELLHKDGFRDIEGLDYSQPMLDKAGQKDVYRALIQGDMTKPLGIVDNAYDAVISVGTFTCGHVGPEAFGELIRITRTGGAICFTVREQTWVEDGYRAKLREIENKGHWELQELRTADYILQEGARCKVCLYEIPA